MDTNEPENLIIPIPSSQHAGLQFTPASAVDIFFTHFVTRFASNLTVLGYTALKRQRIENTYKFSFLRHRYNTAHEIAIREDLANQIAGALRRAETYGWPPFILAKYIQGMTSLYDELWAQMDFECKNRVV